jgi:hypothetical protein
MRTAVACVVLAAAIATPGVVVAAMSSGGHSVFLAGTSVSGRLQVAPARTPPIDPALRPAVRAVSQALAARGIQLNVIPTGPGAAEAIAVPGSSGCPTVIVFAKTGAPAPSPSLGGSCVTTGMRIKGLTIIYFPPSIGPTIEHAMAGLPR